MLEVRELKPTRKNLRAFVCFPIALYKGDKTFAPPLIYEELDSLDPKKNPAYEFCETRLFMAYRDGKAVGRVCALLNHRYNEYANVRYMRFTRLDFIDDAEVFDALMAKVEDWARERKLDKVQGPIGFCDLDKQGLLVEGFDAPAMFVTTYNHPYYAVHLERRGYLKDADWVERIIDANIPPDPAVKKVSEIIVPRLKLRKIPLRRNKDVMPYVRDVFDLYNKAYAPLYGMIPLTEKQIDLYTGMYFSFLNLDYVSIWYDEEGLAAFGVAIPTLVNALRKSGGRLFPFGWYHLLRAMKTEKRLEMLLIAVRPKLQGKGLNAVVVSDVHQRALDNGILEAETGPTLELNEKIQAHWNRYPSRMVRRRRCYVKSL